ncbi:class I SAM-dependent methyltransferase [Nostoc sp.]|uniref:class I SAM-dependent methyltransferase n=1 Tax=Nostoc sp. TaxID=1180 RepID=UPI002FF700CD
MPSLLNTNQRSLPSSLFFQFKKSQEFEQFVADILHHSKNRLFREPSPNPYALLPEALAFLDELLEKTLPSCIVEFGSGESTILFCTWASIHQKSVTTVENERNWLNQIKLKISPKIASIWDVIHAPLRLQLSNLRLFFTYSLANDYITKIKQADIIFIDGPHIPGREIVLFTALNNCKPGAIIIMDDFDIAPIRKILAMVPANLAVYFAGVPVEKCGRGFYILRCSESVPQHIMPSSISFLEIVLSYWRTIRDYLRFGTGDS